VVKKKGLDLLAIILIVLSILLVSCCIGVFVKIYLARRNSENVERFKAIKVD